MSERFRNGEPPNSSRFYLEQFVARAAKSIPSGSLMLDAGAGNCQYRVYFPHVRYETADYCQVDKVYGELTHVCDLSAIPVDAGRYDLILLSQVLEHLAEPAKVLRELFRVLKPGGQLWLSAPLFYEEHEVPYDFYRYTQYGFRYLLASSGFEIKELNWLEGYYGTLAYQLCMAGRVLPRHPANYGGGLAGTSAACVAVLAKPLLSMLGTFFARMDHRKKVDWVGMCKNYSMIAIKPLE